MKRRRHRKSAIIVPVASMGDIAFLLIIFFMVCSRMAQQSIDVESPMAPSLEELKEPRITVTLDADGIVYFQGAEESVANIEYRVRALVEGKKNPEDRLVTFRCDRTVIRTVFEPVIESIARGGGIIAAMGDLQADGE